MAAAVEDQPGAGPAVPACELRIERAGGCLAVGDRLAGLLDPGPDGGRFRGHVVLQQAPRYAAEPVEGVVGVGLFEGEPVKLGVDLAGVAVVGSLMGMVVHLGSGRGSGQAV